MITVLLLFRHGIFGDNSKVRTFSDIGGIVSVMRYSASSLLFLSMILCTLCSIFSDKGPHGRPQVDVELDVFITGKKDNLL